MEAKIYLFPNICSGTAKANVTQTPTICCGWKAPLVLLSSRTASKHFRKEISWATAVSYFSYLGSGWLKGNFQAMTLGKRLPFSALFRVGQDRRNAHFVQSGHFFRVNTRYIFFFVLVSAGGEGIGVTFLTKLPVPLLLPLLPPPIRAC